MNTDQIEVTPRDGKFVVIIKENGEVFARVFSFEQHAQARAHGQRIRLVNAILNAPLCETRPMVRRMSCPARIRD